MPYGEKSDTTGSSGMDDIPHVTYQMPYHVIYHQSWLLLEAINWVRVFPVKSIVYGSGVQESGCPWSFNTLTLMISKENYLLHNSVVATKLAKKLTKLAIVIRNEIYCLEPKLVIFLSGDLCSRPTTMDVLSSRNNFACIFLLFAAFLFNQCWD